MRNDFVDELTTIAADDERVVLLTADLGFHVLEQFAERFPERFINVGVAEQNMMGMATGLAREGFLPFVYSIAPFVVVRAMEFIKNGPVAHSLPVRMVAVGAGVAYGQLGVSHYLIEDLAAFAPYESLHVQVPADRIQARASLRHTYAVAEPVYYRPGKNDPDCIEWIGSQPIEDGASIVGSGADLMIVAMGRAARNAEQARQRLVDEGNNVGMVVVHQLQPFPADVIGAALATATKTLVLEDHASRGGLKQRMSDHLWKIVASQQVYEGVGIPFHLATEGIRSEPAIYRAAGLDPESIYRRCKTLIS